MAGKYGKLAWRKAANGKRFPYLDFRPHGRVYSFPDPSGGPRPVVFATRAQAERVLEGIRGRVADGLSIERALAPFLSRPSVGLLIDRRLPAWLEHRRELVAQGKRSPTTLREEERYCRAGGHFDFWRNRTILEISTKDLDDFLMWLGRREISPKTQKNVLGAFRSFYRWLRRRDELDGIQEPEWPEIEVPEYLPRTVTLDIQMRIMEAIPWARRGAFLAAATESLRLGEVRALDLDDYLGDGRLRVAKAKQGPRADARTVEHTKNRTARERHLWHPELVRWIEWRLKQATPDARLRGEVALFWCPEALNQAKRWTPDPLEQEWRAACARAGIVYVPFQQGTR
ncbi:MAG TPA: phage integrase N-terminal SAM-like domain-containing protein, partial [Myxococcota bacterium]|nr:phage integrase N-terminal SAM-like domain-containing protein [Myxococcota bacterium]